MKPALCFATLLLAFLYLTTALPAIRGEEPTEPEFTDHQIEFFERKIRPLLVSKCYKCHSPEKDEPDAGLRLDSRAWILKGGDSGPAIVPGKPESSLLVEAINYDGFEMPPRNQLPEDQIALLELWVKQGAPWPKEANVEVVEDKQFPLFERKAAHWSWQPIKVPAVPTVANAEWPQDEVDNFVLAKLEAAQLKPAPRASRRTLIRRAYFDLVGLPPTPAQVQSFLNDPAPTREAFAQLIDELLASPHYGERWARHWLDSFRYASTRGHEFDPLAPNAYQYRDYLIRALNADIPYNDFVREHIAGDLIEKPRMHPERDFNESILATGFWFLNEQVHSPVDIRADEVDRLDNMIDAATRSFLGLTVSCARCHDHKFDAIATKDYYSLHGYLQSSRYVQTRFDSIEQNKRIANDLAKLRDQSQRDLKQRIGAAVAPVASQSSDYLLAAREVLLNGQPSQSKPRADRVVADFEAGTYDGWTVTGTAFGERPHTNETIAPYQGRINGQGKFFVNSHNVRDNAEGDRPTGTMTSDEFVIDRKFLTMLVGGGSHAGKTCVNLLVDGKVVLTATGRSSNQMFPEIWDLQELAGKHARLQIVDEVSTGWGNIGLDQVVLTDQASAAPVAIVSFDVNAERIAKVAQQRNLDAKLLERWTKDVVAARSDDRSPLHFWATVALDARAGDKEFVARSVAKQVASIVQPEPTAADNVVIDYSRPVEFYGQEGFSFHLRPRAPGDIVWGNSSESPIEQLHVFGAARLDPLFGGMTVAPGTEVDPGALKFTRAGRTLHTPTFDIADGSIWYVVQGKGKVSLVVDSHRVIQGPLHKVLVRGFDTRGEIVAHPINAADYRGHNAHLEFTPTDDSTFAVFQVTQGPKRPAIPMASPGQLLAEQLRRDKPANLVDLTAAYQQVFAQVTARLRQDQLATGAHPSSTALWANWVIHRLPQFGASLNDDKLQAAVQTLLSGKEKLATRIVKQSRTAMGMMDGTGRDEHVLIRGSHKNIGEVAPRQLLLAISGTDQPAPKQGSGRLELAERMVDPSNPFASRVIVNRLWYHLTGRGIVSSVDNFGVLGQEPTHPELLDHLASRFIKEGWSQKHMIREIMLSSTYMMSSLPEAEAERTDPENRLLHRMRIRRMQGEIIRDTMLAMSGRLDPKLEGPPVEIYLTPFMTGRGRPGASGPLDGAGRRSVYVRVRRNFLSPMMLAFDSPIPFAAVGKRNVSNVPAQALTLMNDPFVLSQAKLWAERILKDGDRTSEHRIVAIYEQGLGRPPTATESADAVEFLKAQAKLYGVADDGWSNDPRGWTDLCHVMFNVKEFIYIN